MDDIKRLADVMRQTAAAQVPSGYRPGPDQVRDNEFALVSESEPYKIRLELVEAGTRMRVKSYVNENKGDAFAASAPLDLTMEKAVRAGIQSALIDIETLRRRAARPRSPSSGMGITTIEFESGGNYITARQESGNVLIRCNFNLTDCRDDEPLDSFVTRHGGADATAGYLEQCYSARHAKEENTMTTKTQQPFYDLALHHFAQSGGVRVEKSFTQGDVNVTLLIGAGTEAGYTLSVRENEDRSTRIAINGSAKLLGEHVGLDQAKVRQTMEESLAYVSEQFAAFGLVAFSSIMKHATAEAAKQFPNDIRSQNTFKREVAERLGMTKQQIADQTINKPKVRESGIGR